MVTIIIVTVQHPPPLRLLMSKLVEVKAYQPQIETFVTLVRKG